MTAMGNLLAALFVILGALFALVASVGILRLPDFYTRVHAASKAGTVGSALALVALAIVSVQTAEVLRAIAAIVFFFLTAPIAAHLLGKAAYSAGYRMWSGSVLDEMQARRPATEEGDGSATKRPIL
ncbi:monovalent cation/H(+) antiporter subunit G [Aureimonas phyllosphaerae]|uniref:Multicomponent Na+:H+ antiporter subunit G n=1 Tax=Aureimonas phyllosphaerae TaxID=1166078 RepID=A0A7W6BZD8_9HYPH|nr:monovalent cation/H(+) antiporter subunit G [Aureimonas phyllosphaerae]MBB3935592.1 multicomponent Na+:H+ antiporter subunit G [Aureimonas phyllosphaerae]MBB3959600.1 multicomponent Na+:H+ antiporter subunit G [Aureimonas phyllosphaerae]SFF12714.1 multicomponent Na+:H+ antiporter subunit G [Aureimonas phyllosphaerae]